MTLKAILDSRDEIPEGLAEHYAEQDDGRFFLQLDGAENSEAIAGLRAALKKERKRADDAESAVKKFGDVDPDGLTDRLERLEALEASDSDTATKIQEAATAAKRRADEAWRSKVEAAEAKAETAVSKLNRRVLDGDLNESLQGIGITKQSLLKAARLMLIDRGADVVEDEEGNPVGVLKDEHGEMVPVSAFVKRWAGTPEAGDYITASEKAGSGADGDTRVVGKGGVRRVSRSDPEVYSKYSKEIQSGEVVLVD